MNLTVPFPWPPVDTHPRCNTRMCESSRVHSKPVPRAEGLRSARRGSAPPRFRPPGNHGNVREPAWQRKAAHAVSTRARIRGQSRCRLSRPSPPPGWSRCAPSQDLLPSSGVPGFLPAQPTRSWGASICAQRGEVSTPASQTQCPAFAVFVSLRSIHPSI